MFETSQRTVNNKTLSNNNLLFEYNMLLNALEIYWIQVSTGFWIIPDFGIQIANPV